MFIKVWLKGFSLVSLSDILYCVLIWVVIASCRILYDLTYPDEKPKANGRTRNDDQSDR
jgi:hypothetical protein